VSQRVDGLDLQWVGNDGAGDRPLLVFLHEALGSIGLWRGFPQALCDATGHRGLVYSRAGHGRSQKREPDAYEFDFLEREAVQALPALLQNLGVDGPYALFGHSDGASIALLHAAAFPQRVRAAIVLAPHIRVEAVTVAGVEAAQTTWEQGDLPQRMARHHDDAPALFRRWSERWRDPAFRAWSIEHRLSAIRCPVLAVQGEADPYGTQAQIDGIAERAPHCELLKLPGCGHAPHLECPQAVIDASVRFLRAVSTAPAG
jgi:pimeloyl-ACP methyl ester carboxylesterase